MRFTTVISNLLLALNVGANPLPGESPEDAIADVVETRDVTPATPLLEKRACNYNGCRCNSRGKQLTVCGSCIWPDTNSWVVTSKRVANHIFECSPSGNCCDYGYATDCGTGSGNGRCIVN